ncbi:MAG: enoyl-CoA hydratase/isomerase family protein [Chloroflexi bacterium]|nr:enoyl-CoA hydratase/isomerase family protein [Chloroflexota bacterium]
MPRQRKYKTLLYERDKEEPHIAYVILNRPEKNNAISIGPGEMTDEIQQAMNEASRDDSVKVVIFKGNGRNFSAGFDLSMVFRVYGGKPGVRPAQAKRLQIDYDHIMGMPRGVLNCSKVTIAQIHGWCIEAAIFIVESCDIAVAATNAKFAHRGQRLAFGGMPFMALEMFEGHTKKITELLITGRTVSGKDAEEMGIITHAVPERDLDNEVHNLARAICNLPLDAIVMGKLNRRLVYDATGMNSVLAHVMFHTLGTNLVYAEDEKENVFIRDRERLGHRAAFHKLHDAYEDLLGKTKSFKSYQGE